MSLVMTWMRDATDEERADMHVLFHALDKEDALPGFETLPVLENAVGTANVGEVRQAARNHVCRRRYLFRNHLKQLEAWHIAVKLCMSECRADRHRSILTILV